MCMLCKCSEETTSHLNLSYSFAMKVWGKVEALLGLENLWRTHTLKGCLLKWFTRGYLKLFSEFPYLVI